MIKVEDCNDFHQVAAISKSFEYLTAVIVQVMHSDQFYTLNFFDDENYSDHLFSPGL